MPPSRTPSRAGTPVLTRSSATRWFAINHLQVHGFDEAGLVELLGEADSDAPAEQARKYDEDDSCQRVHCSLRFFARGVVEGGLEAFYIKLPAFNRDGAHQRMRRPNLGSAAVDQHVDGWQAQHAAHLLTHPE